MAERDITHNGAALLEFCAWLVQTTGAQPAQIAVAIETPRGPVVETLLERGFAVYSIKGITRATSGVLRVLLPKNEETSQPIWLTMAAAT